MTRFYLFLLFLLISMPSQAQHVGDTIVQLPSVRRVEPRMIVQRIPRASIYFDPQAFKTSNNLSDMLAKNPGVNQITTGAISKPMIHGLYGYRILPVVNGMRYDAQQWQDEHGLGLSQIGIRDITLRTCSGSAQYGSEAIGGVIDVTDERADSGKNVYDATIRLHSNTLGTLSDVGYAHGKGMVQWNIRGGIESHADYSDGDGNRVLNSREAGYYLKAGFGFRRKNWSQYNYYDFSYNQFGFILEGMGNFMAPDARWTRAMSGPHHNVMLNFFSSKNEITFGPKTNLELNAGVQSNKRAEDESGGSISLDIHLLSLLQNAKLFHELSRHWRLQVYESLTYENNHNNGKRVLIPDANLLEGNISAGGYYYSDNLTAGACLGFGSRHITSSATGILNPPGSEVAPFSTKKNALSGSAWLRYSKNNNWNINFFLASGYRAPNLAELSTNGIHEGTFQFEIGDPNLKTEKNINGILEFIYEPAYNKHKIHVRAQASVYDYLFRDYIYLAPTNEFRFGLYRVFRYRQQNAQIYGADGGITFSIDRGNSNDYLVDLKFTGGYVMGVAAHDSSLPFMPAPKVSAEIKYYLKDRGSIRNCFTGLSIDYVFQQDHPAQFETSTADYGLLNFNAGMHIGRPNRGIDLDLQVKNLLNKKYADHLSRLKYYGLYNQGLNIVIAISRKISW